MMTAVNEWKDQLGSLPEAARLELVVFLMQTLEPSEPDAEEAWQIEVSRRAEEVRQGRAKGRPAAEVFRTMRERHP